MINLKQVYTFQSNQIKFENPKSPLPLKRFIVRFLIKLNPRKPKERFAFLIWETKEKVSLQEESLGTKGERRSQRKQR